MEPREYLLRLMENQRGMIEDNLLRAEYSFAGLSNGEMQKEFGQSGQTKQEILDSYIGGMKTWQEAKDFLMELLDEAIPF